MSIAGGLDKAVARAVLAGCDALQVFTSNSNQWAARPLADAECGAFRDRVREAGLHPVLAHDSYLINVGSPDAVLWDRSVAALGAEVDRCAALGIPYLVMHPGSHVGSGEDAAFVRIAAALDRVLGTREPDVTILLENTAGQGTCVGHRFEHLAAILERVREPDRVGVCVDTAHTFAAGHDIATDEGWETTWRDLDRAVGWARVRAVHVNDSKKELGSRVDRHEQIGLGLIGAGAFWRLMNDPRFDALAGSLETDKCEECLEDEQNLLVLRRMVGLKRPPARAKVEAWRAEARADFVARRGEPKSAASSRTRSGRTTKSAAKKAASVPAGRAR